MGQKQGLIGGLGATSPEDLVTPRFKRKVSRLFDGLDMDGNGVLEKSEVIEKFKQNHNKGNEAEKLFAIIDTDQSGNLERQEFIEFWAQVAKQSANNEKKVIAHLENLMIKIGIENVDEDDDDFDEKRETIVVRKRSEKIIPEKQRTESQFLDLPSMPTKTSMSSPLTSPQNSKSNRSVRVKLQRQKTLYIMTETDQRVEERTKELDGNEAEEQKVLEDLMIEVEQMKGDLAVKEDQLSAMRMKALMEAQEMEEKQAAQLRELDRTEAKLQ